MGYAGALAAVAAVSLLVRLVEQHAHPANISMIYLVAVLGTAALAGSRPAVVAAVAAFLTFNWFFVQPVNTFVVADPAEWVALLLFLATATVTGQLAGALRHRAEEAEERERETARLRREATEAEVLRRSDELKDALLNAVSHNLRTPLASIVTWAGSLRQKDLAWTDDERREVATAIEQEALRLNGIVTNLLDLSRMKAGGLAPVKEWHDLAALIDHVAGRMAPVLSQHPVEIRVSEDLPPVALDWVQVDQVLSNLVENAASYTPPGTLITIGAALMDGEARVWVEDAGPGVPADLLPRLFEPFVRGGASRSTAGIGLGLPVAKGLVEAHGGRIWAEDPGRGVRFAFSLPLAPRAAPEPELAL